MVLLSQRFFFIVVFCLFNKIFLMTVTIYLGWRWSNLGQGEKRRIFLLLYRCSQTALVGKKISYDGSDQVSQAETIWVVLQEKENILMGVCVSGDVGKMKCMTTHPKSCKFCSPSPCCGQPYRLRRVCLLWENATDPSV